MVGTWPLCPAPQGVGRPWPTAQWVPGPQGPLLPAIGWSSGPSTGTLGFSKESGLLDFCMPFPDCSMFLQKRLRHFRDHTNHTHWSPVYDNREKKINNCLKRKGQRDVPRLPKAAAKPKLVLCALGQCEKKAKEKPSTGRGEAGVRVRTPKPRCVCIRVVPRTCLTTAPSQWWGRGPFPALLHESPCLWSGGEAPMGTRGRTDGSISGPRTVARFPSLLIPPPALTGTAKRR